MKTPYIPQGCDQQGRIPEAAYDSAEGACGAVDDIDTPHRYDVLLVMGAFLLDWCKKNALWLSLLGVPAAVLLLGLAAAVWP